MGKEGEEGRGRFPRVQRGAEREITYAYAFLHANDGLQHQSARASLNGGEVAQIIFGELWRATLSLMGKFCQLRSSQNNP